MSRITLALAAVAATLLLAPGLEAQDVMKVASNHYRILLENSSVRVVENTLAPGESDPAHTHPRGWYYVTQPGQMKIVFASGKSEMWDAKPGEAGWIKGEAAHTSENVGATPLTYVLVELKDTYERPAHVAHTK